MGKLYVYVDNRETPSGIPDELSRRQILVYKKNLSVADYIVSERCAVERKTTSDFITSVFDGRLHDQFRRLSEVYEIPVLILEGSMEDIYADDTLRKILLKLLPELAIEYNCRIIPTNNKDSTVNVLVSLIHYEQLGNLKHPLTRKKPKTLSKAELAKYILMGFPSIGAKTSEKLLLKFRTLRNVFTAPKIQIARVKGVGKHVAEQIDAILDYDYLKKESPKNEQKKLEGI